VPSEAGACNEDPSSARESKDLVDKTACDYARHRRHEVVLLKAGR
jgi:hypothetical protein